ncbi:MAG: G5 domain-containing protein [Clostridia bacterium]|nr:G5 domain-containing protein [Clostridia bacterium]
MGNVINAVRGLGEKLRSRAASVVMLAVVCAMLAVAITANLTSVSIRDGQEVTTVITMRRDTKTILNKASVAISVNDQVVETSVDDNTRSIVILRAFPVTIVDGGKEISIETVGGFVNDILLEAGIPALGQDDVLTPAEDAQVTEGMTINIDRVTFEDKRSTQSVAYSTEKVKDSSMLKGETKVSVKGVNGEKEIITRYKYVNGECVSSKVVSTKVTKKPVNEKILVGTKVKTTTTTTKKASSKSSGSSSKSKINTDTKSGTITVDGKTIKYKKLLTGTGTAYTAPKGAKCSTGCKPGVGKVAVNPKVIPYGTRMFITSADGKFVYGYAVAADTGGAMLSGRVLCDLYMNTERECYNFGRRKINVYIL